MKDDLFSTAVRLLSLAVHGTFFVLLAIAMVRSVAEGVPGAAVGGAVLGAAYLVIGPIDRRTRRANRRDGAQIWLVLLTLGWAGLTVASPSFVWLAFPLFFVYMYLLSLPVALVGVVLLTGAAIGLVAWPGGGVTLAEVLGPSIGAAVATFMTLAYKALYEEGLRRQRLIEELVATRERLVRAEADAAKLTERERLAREIHDTLAQGMSSIILLLRAVRRDLDADAAPRAADSTRPNAPPRRTSKRHAGSCSDSPRPSCTDRPSPTRCAASPSRRRHGPRSTCTSTPGASPPTCPTTTGPRSSASRRAPSATPSSTPAPTTCR
ncbi:histidine kinase [Actinomadura sp. CNU-125]|uniref:histidine kinase n=1 Tax=Actinomadura sp. CNU-125 TaxID=1904961 RepID=UPI0021CC7A65|nr:histidine kinase [Actinomadura sp. CNU-125]